jgi:glycosyltransferase involved in cell wall biosynthesis
LKLAIVVPSLGAGGAERVAGIVANGLARSGVQVTFIALDQPNQPRHVDLESEVHLMRLALTGESRNSLIAISTNWTRIRALRRALQSVSPDCVLSAVTETNVLTLMAVGRRWPVLVWEHTDPWLWTLKKPWWWARWLLYRRAVSVVFLSRHHANYFQRRGYQIMSEVMPNPVPALSAADRSEGAIPVTKPFILSVGRLDRLKGFFELLDLFKQVKSNHPEWSLVIVGDGNEATALKQSAEDLGIAQSVYFIGAVMDPYPYYRACDIFISLSELEGFPMALIEAMSCGCPVVMNAYSEAVHEIIDHGQNGFIVDRSNKENLHQLVERLMVDDKLRKQIGHNGTSVLSTYAEPKIIACWKQLISAAL